MQSDRYERISVRAYHIWVAEGRVHGMHDEHWQRAEREIAEEELRVAAALADRAAGATRRRPRAAPAGAKVARGKPGGAKAPAAGKSPTKPAPRQPRARAKPASS